MIQLVLMNKLVERIRIVGLFCIKWRYVIALIAFVLGVALQLHGSSINEYNKMFANSAEYDSESIILGESRAIRSDEWLVVTPNHMSQTYNDFEENSDMMSLGGQDMAITTNGPILDATILAKPFMWGYVLLGNEYGLAWHWCAKIIVLLLASFELCMIVTQKNKKVSLIGALLLTFAPAMQWWSIFDVYIWGMVLSVLGYYFFTSNGWLKNLCTVLLPFAAVAFALIFYPAFQIPTALFVAVLLVALLVRDKSKITFKKIDILRIMGIVIVAGGILAYMVLTCWGGIVAMMGTAYPGAVTALGGDGAIKDLFTDLTSFTLPFKNVTYSNNSEISTFVHFAPVFLMLYPIIYKKMKRNRNMIVGNILVISLAAMIVFMLVGFPELLAKLTLFSYITRMKLTYGFVATIFTVWGIDMVWRREVLTKKRVLIVLGICVVWYVCFIGPNELSYLDWWQYWVIIIGLMGLVYVILMRYQKLSLVGVTVLMGVCGMTVNPIVHGATAILGHPLEKEIAKIATEDKEAYWLAVGDGKLASIAVANGAKTLNMVNVYPDFKKWELIDPEGDDKDTYNRYAHIWVKLTDGETDIRLGPTRDVVELDLSCSDALKWPAKYLVTAGKLENCKANYQRIYDDSEGNYYIYERISDV